MNAKKFLSDRYNHELASFFRMMLMMIEDMKKDHDFHYEKLYNNIPEEYHCTIDTANHFTEDKKNWIRKRILDYGNESIRNLQSEINNYSVSFIFKQ